MVTVKEIVMRRKLEISQMIHRLKNIMYLHNPARLYIDIARDYETAIQRALEQLSAAHNALERLLAVNKFLESEVNSENEG